MLAKGSWARRQPCSFFTITLDFVTATLGLMPVFISHIPTYIKTTVLLPGGPGCAVGAAALAEEGEPQGLACGAGCRRRLSPSPTPPVTSCSCPKSRLHWCWREMGKGRGALKMRGTSPHLTREISLLLGWPPQSVLWTRGLNSHQSHLAAQALEQDPCFHLLDPAQSPRPHRK